MFKKYELWGPSIVEAIVWTLAGILILIEPGMTSLLLANFMSLIAIGYGGYMIYRWAALNQTFSDFTIGTAMSVVGIYFFLNPEIIVAALPMVAGVGLIVDGISKISSAIRVHKQGGSLIGMMLAIGLPILLGTTMLVWPVGSFEAFVIVFGISLIVLGLADAVSVLLINASLSRQFNI